MSSRSTSVRSLDAAYADFLRAPSSHEGLTNESYVESVIGHLNVVDTGGQYDAAKEKYEKPVSTFRQAFNACFPARKHGKRSWADFDLETLRECGFPDLEIPSGVQRALTREEARYLATREDEARYLAAQSRELGYDAPEPEYIPVDVEEEAPPLELSTRPEDYEVEREYLEPADGEYEPPPLELLKRTDPAPRGTRKRRGVRAKKSSARRAERRDSRPARKKSSRKTSRKSGRKLSATAAVLARLIANVQKRKKRSR